MAKRNSGSSPVSGTAKSGSAKKRPPITAVKKPFPWGTVIGGGLLALALIGIVVYAATNQGEGFTDPLEAADERFPGINAANIDELERNHVEGPVDYPSVPPLGGNHSAVPQQCDVYTEPIPTESAVHSLEHGAVWITYSSELPEDQVDALTGIVEGDPYGLLSPVPDQDAPVIATAWGRQLTADSADDDRIEEFFDTYKSGPQTPERGAACVGSATTGSLGGAPAPATAPSSPAASPEPSSPVAPSIPVPSEPVEPSPAG